MRNFNRRSPIRERIAGFMAGRYGVDRLYYFLLAICSIIIIINIFASSFVLSLIESALIAYTFYRVMSRNIYHR